MGEEEPGATVAAYSLAERGTYFRATRVSPDGSRIAFQSRAPLTDYDNTDTDGGGRR